MTKKVFYDTDTKIAKVTRDKSYSVQNRSGLSLIKRGESKYFEGKFRFPFHRDADWAVVQIGVWSKEINVEEALLKWHEIKRWSKENNKHPKFFSQQIPKSEKTFLEVANEYMNDVYIPKRKRRTWQDRQNKLNQCLKYFGEHQLIADFEFDNQGRVKIKKMLKDVFETNGAHYQLVRCRQLFTWIFEYAEEEQYIRDNQNPLPRGFRFQWEGVKHQKKGNVTLAKGITNKSWGDVPKFLQSVNENPCNTSPLALLALKAHLLLCIRSGVVVRLEWNWYDAEEDMWVIPAETEGLKRRLGDEDNVHHIPSTPEINKLMSQVRKISGWQKYVFYSLGGKNQPHLGEETLNDTIQNLGWKGKQSAHGWRDVITTGTLEHSDIHYEIIDRQLGRLAHKQGTRGHYDESTLLGKRREFMAWWSKTMIELGLIV